MPGHTILRHLKAVATLPGIGIVVVPGFILSRTSGWHGLSTVPPAAQFALIVMGFAFVVLGLVIMMKTISLFVRVGNGTLAPWDPTKMLVVQGIYRHVRNPMITGVAMVLLGESAFFASLWLLGWFLAFALVSVAYIPLIEEPGLVRRFSSAYLEYRYNVPRWVPRIRPWIPPPHPRSAWETHQRIGS